MRKYFIPYAGKNPAAIDIKGHKLLILSSEKNSLNEQLQFFGGNEIKELRFIDENSKLLEDLAEQIDGGVVLTPPGVSVSILLRNLEKELPWIH